LQKIKAMIQKKPFLIFSDIASQDDVCCCFVLPVSEGNDFVLTNPDLPAQFTFQFTNLAGELIEDQNGMHNSSEINKYNNGIIDLTGIDLAKIMAPGDCFRIKISDIISNPFQYIGCKIDETHLFDFWDDDEKEKQRIRLRCEIDNAQSKTDKNEYEDANGFVHLLSKKRRKEFQFKTDFYPEYVHDAIKEMFLYPNLVVDNEIDMFESGDYEIKWEEKDENNNTIGTTKISEHEISKYFNC